MRCDALALCLIVLLSSNRGPAGKGSMSADIVGAGNIVNIARNLHLPKGSLQLINTLKGCRIQTKFFF